MMKNDSNRSLVRLYKFRKQQGENISNPTNDFVPKVYITQDIQHDAVKDEKMTQGVQDYLDAAIHNNVDKIIDPQSLDNEGLDVNVTQEEEGSVTSNEELYKITEQQYSDDEEGLMDINETQEEEGSVTSNEELYKITEQQYSDDEEGSMDDTETQEEEGSVTSNEELYKITEQQYSDDEEGLMDINETQEEEGSVTSNEELYKITEQQYSDDEEGLMDINETQEEEGSVASNEDMYKITEQQYSEDEEGSMDVNGVPRNVEISNPEYNYNQNIKIKQEIMDDSYNATYPVPRNVEISNPEYNYNQNIKIKQEIMNDSNQATYPSESMNTFEEEVPCHSNRGIKQEVIDDSYYATYPMQEAGCSSSMHSDFSPAVIKQEVLDDGYNESIITETTYDCFTTTNEYISNMDQPTQNISNMQGYIMQPENSPFMVKQEILDDGNIEIFTDVLKPSADQEDEGGNSW
ncbi:uncharacterized protein LOC111038415 isoform X2 [Myzus persicae]|uniref:uncharacterized protein LOC111038415 isoform X2 n=1 Tax=Myzus persicae TaxID=13164 RepID=UPI000B934F91|nr:uncharacterized protein LOC111038415 isoform X2 [Myzus persicae]